MQSLHRRWSRRGWSCLELINENFKIEKLAVSKLPRSGKPEELLEYEEIDANAIIKTVLKLTQKG